MKTRSDAACRRDSSVRERERVGDEEGAVLYTAGSGRDVTDSGGGCSAWQSASSHTAHSASARQRKIDVPLVESRRSEERGRAIVDYTKTAT